VVGACAADVESSDGFEISSWIYGDLFFAVHDTQVRVLDDGDDFATVTWTEIDVRAGDRAAAACVHFSLCARIATVRPSSGRNSTTSYSCAVVRPDAPAVQPRRH
jgi:hypothetical protein